MIVSQTNSKQIRSLKKIDWLKFKSRGVDVTESLNIRVLLTHLVDCLDYLHNGIGLGQKNQYIENLRSTENDICKMNLITAEEFALFAVIFT